jgi:hypothetical protein
MKIFQIKEYESLEFYMQFHNEIPTKSGIYSWVFWPFKESHIKEVNFSILINTIKYFSAVNINYSETSSTGYKFEVSVKEKGFENNFIGLSLKKEEQLKNYLKASEDNRNNFLEYLKLVCISRPFYVGKADNLNQRLRQHFEGVNSDILRFLRDQKINFNDVLICFELIDMQFDDSINNVYEEITQRIIKPGLTKRPG